MKWKAIGYPMQEMPPYVMPMDLEMDAEERAANVIRLAQAGVIGEPGQDPDSSPADPGALLRLGQPRRRLGRRQRPRAVHGPVAVQRRRAVARRRRQRLDPGRRRRDERGRRRASNRSGATSSRSARARSHRPRRCCSDASRSEAIPATCFASASCSPSERKADDARSRRPRRPRNGSPTSPTSHGSRSTSTGTGCGWRGSTRARVRRSSSSTASRPGRFCGGR